MWVVKWVVFGNSTFFLSYDYKIIEEIPKFPNIPVQVNIPHFQLHNIAKPTATIYFYTISIIHRKKPTDPDPLKNQQHPIIPI